MESSLEEKEEIPVPSDRPLSGGKVDGDMPSWSDFMKQLENEQPSKPKGSNKKTINKSTKLNGQQTLEEKEKQKMRKEQELKRRKEMKELMKKKKEQISIQKVDEILVENKENSPQEIQIKLPKVSTSSKNIKEKSESTPQQEIDSETEIPPNFVHSKKSESEQAFEIEAKSTSPNAEAEAKEKLHKEKEVERRKQMREMMKKKKQEMAEDVPGYSKPSVEISSNMREEINNSDPKTNSTKSASEETPNPLKRTESHPRKELEQIIKTKKEELVQFRTQRLETNSFGSPKKDEDTQMITQARKKEQTELQKSQAYPRTEIKSPNQSKVQISVASSPNQTSPIPFNEKKDLNLSTNESFERILSNLKKCDGSDPNEKPKYSKREIFEIEKFAKNQALEDAKPLISSLEQLQIEIQKCNQQKQVLKEKLLQFEQSLETLPDTVKNFLEKKQKKQQMLEKLEKLKSWHYELQESNNKSLNMQQSLKDSIDRERNNSKLIQQKFGNLKSGAEQKVDDLNFQMQKLRNQTQQTVFYLSNQVKKLNISGTSLEERRRTLEQENQNLVQLCEDLLQHFGGNEI